MKNKLSNIKNELLDVISIVTFKKFIISVVFVLLSNFPAIFSYYQDLNFGAIFYGLLTNQFHYALLFGVIIFSIIDISLKTKNNILVMKYKNYAFYLKSFLKKIIIYVSFLLIISLCFNVLTACFRSNFNFQNIILDYYDISLFVYLIFFLIREIIIIILLTTIIFYFYNLIKNKLLCLIIAALFFFIIFFHSHYTIINSLAQLPLLFIDYLTNVIYANIFLEISGSIIQIFLFSFIIIYLESRINRSSDLL